MHCHKLVHCCKSSKDHVAPLKNCHVRVSLNIQALLFPLQVENDFFFYFFPSYNLESSIWNVVPVSKGPLQRYGHTLALYQVWTQSIFCIINLYMCAVSNLKLSHHDQRLLRLI